MIKISLINLIIMLLPVSFVWYFYYKWTKNFIEIPYSTIRMILQLIAIGYVLVFIFKNKNMFLGGIILIFMLIFSTIIILRNTKNKNFKNYFCIFFATFISSSLNLFIIVYVILEIKYIYEPKYIIPIAGMVLSNTMNVLSLAIERFEKEIQRNEYFEDARNIAFKASLIPQINSLLAVGIVTLPGMMTGQIISGVDPLIAVRYQIMIALLGISGGGMGAVLYFLLINRAYK
ncbi:ABC transporter permease [Campylobacter sp. FMV-PI01]|uniref:ABC transporter permease n=1 Tax=Campylobacter portucalensis TaxID=2608384 RepID=A0A6L5WMW3_9BACT|nr:ABC transporter permease [Campylobacter portucalensis]MSN97001.1 ABC transporter permease [Campylobacter portucalensis]